MKPEFTARLVTLACLLFSCDIFEPAAPANEEVLDGPVAGLSDAEKVRFLEGDRAFNDETFTPASGLGPLFVSNACGSCHPGDGKGHPFTTLIRFGQSDSLGNQYIDLGGPQLQNRAIAPFQPEQLPQGISFTRLTPPANSGLGFLDAVSDDDILAWADADDVDGDGISGVPNWISLKAYSVPRVYALTRQGKYIGRFGKKAAVYDLHQQTVQAYNEDIGICSSYEAYDTHSRLEVDPEITDQTVHDVVFYLKTLKAPVARNTRREDVVAGRAIFDSIGCGKCHRPELKTGPSPIAALSAKVFHPYTDLLLHDMGPALDDGYTEGSATTAEWRTPPLWGLGLSTYSQGGEYFLLHDGRARSIEEAILLHGGEGEGSRSDYERLSEMDKQKLKTFLENL